MIGLISFSLIAGTCLLESKEDGHSVLYRFAEPDFLDFLDFYRGKWLPNSSSNSRSG
jgi:hypothetical protein